jgi:RNA polymerase sigma-70 factor (ECF subfamily)
VTRQHTISKRETIVEKKSSPVPPKSVDVDLFERFFAGDDTAFMEIFDLHTHRLYLYSLKFVGERQAAEDLIQDVWERIMKMRSNGQSAPPNPLALLYRTTRNLSLNHIRDRRHHLPVHSLIDSSHPSAMPREMTHHEELVLIGLQHLPIAQREVLILNAYSDYRFDEIAAMLGEPVGAIRTRAWRARAQLRKILSTLIELESDDDSSRLDNDADQQEEMP